MGRLLSTLLFLALACGDPVGPMQPADVAASVYKVEVRLAFGGPVSPDPEMTGTAWVAARVEGRTFLATAGHICVPSGVEWGFKGIVSAAEYTLVSRDGVQLRGPRVAYRSSEEDLCVLEFRGDAGVPLELAASDPPYAADGYYIGAPNGVWGGGVAGYYSVQFCGRGRPWGPRYEAIAFSSSGAAPGASGSPIVYHGRVVALLNLISRGFGSFGTGVPHESVWLAVESAMRGARG